MQPPVHDNKIDLLCVIAHYGHARKMIRFAQEHGCLGATVCYGMGTAPRKKLTALLDLTDARKEIILMMLDAHRANEVGDLLAARFKLYKPNHGIAFILPISQTLGSHFYSDQKLDNEVTNPMVQAIFAIVEKGLAEDVIHEATKAGARGGTIVNARGSGVHETSKIFNIDITPEKEIVIILAEQDVVDKINTQLVDTFKINEPGKGIIFVQDVKKVYGLS
ncbi:MAG: P-II family nitrogen regulator [Acholeplasmatales bacterium]|nr:MAG: P-II family nitrogen regulator [Acholeplasmatales bacterium]